MTDDRQGRGKGRGGAWRPTKRSHGGKGGPRSPGPPPPGLFAEILLSPDREAVPGARPVVSFRPDDDPALLTEIRRRKRTEIELRRRGLTFGRVAELEPEGLVGPRPRRRRREAIESERWVAARPILLPGAAEAVRPSLLTEDVGALHRSLEEPAGLAAWLARRGPRLEGRFTVADTDAPLEDPERDLARVRLASARGPDDLWLKTGRLSTHADDRSLRMRVSFGVEGDDDASDDESRHRLVAELGRLLVPGLAALAGRDELAAMLERHIGGPALLTQPIAYWNAPGGGARFHHDAFPGENRQRGVLYAQLTGRTVWLALSIEDLFQRARELARWLEEGDAPWLVESLGPGWGDARRALERRADALAELARPGLGVLGPLLESVEATAALVDAGHALVLHPGDVLVLPNHGLERTAMHSVFCGSPEPGYALSVAIRGGA